MTRAKDHRAGLRDDGLNIDFQLTAANQAGIVGRVLGKAELHLTRLACLHHLTSGIPHLSFYAATTDRTCNGAILAHQELGA